MKHRTTTVGMIGVGMLVVALCTMGSANEFYQAGEAREIEGADNFGRTVLHYAIVLGFPVLSLGLMGGGLMTIRRNPALGGGGIVSGIGAAYVPQITGNLHEDAAAVASLADLAGTVPDWQVVLGIVLHAAIIATLICYHRRKEGCGKPAAASLMNP